MPQLSKFATNPFLIATEERNPLMTEILADTEPKLASAVNENALFAPVHAALLANAAQWGGADTTTVNAEAAYQSATHAFEFKLGSLTRKPDDETNSVLTGWCLIIEAVAPQGSTLYTLLLPQGRETLTSGNYETQVNAIKNFGLRLADQATKPTLLALAPVVTAFYTATEALRDTQLQKEQAVKDAREAQETVRVASAETLIEMVGVGMQVWKQTLWRVDELFDVELLRDPELEIPAAPADTTLVIPTRTISTTELPLHATALEVWRLGPGGAPERIAVGARVATAVVIPADITFDAGKVYQLWLVARNSRGASPAGPIQTWPAP